MSEMTLVIMAAGKGSRFGGLKQIADIDGRGQRIIDYSVYDAVFCGFRRVVFIISEQTEEDFRRIGGIYREKYGISVDWTIQGDNDLPSEFVKPIERTKPWGTAHAVSCLDGRLDSPFALINADDFYGRAAFRAISQFLSSPLSDGSYAMVGYKLKNTLSRNGSVSRGICKITDGFVSEICEMSGIHREGNAIISDGVGGRMILSPSSAVSVNMWGFTPEVIKECKDRFRDFLAENCHSDLTRCEFYLPSVISCLIKEKRATVKMLESTDRWLGVTYKGDVKRLRSVLNTYVKKGMYPPKL